MLSGRTAFPTGSVVVMADPVDLTGNPGLGRALASAAAVGLQQSRHLTLLSRARIAEALRRMGRTGDSVLTDSLALEVAARENARAVLSLTVAKVSGQYLLTGRLLSPAGRADIAVHRVSVDRLDAGHRGTRPPAPGGAGERRRSPALPRQPPSASPRHHPLARSAQAVRRGVGSWRRAKYDRAQQLFQRAVALDSGFALAHAALGSLHYFINDRPTGDAHYAAAQRLPQTGSPFGSSSPSTAGWPARGATGRKRAGSTESWRSAIPRGIPGTTMARR